MAKHIIFCADGTWNSPDTDADHDDVPDLTNVFKLFSKLAGTDIPGSLRLKNEQERVLFRNGRTLQIAKYIHGVGDSDNKLVQLMGGAFGAGVVTRIVRGYTFISRNYQAGDKVVLLGFSRGAYTVRALSGLIASMGLLNRNSLNLTDKELAYRAGSAAWYSYRRKSVGRKRSLRVLFAEVVADLPHFLTKAPGPHDFISDIPIQAVAVWDTVGAMGIPEYNDEGQRRDVFKFANTKLSDQVACGFHAVSRDEQRSLFGPTLWDLDARVKQILFAGAHADVGGGYPLADEQSGLSDIALDWMMTQLKGKKVGLRFQQGYQASLAKNSLAPAHAPWREKPWIYLTEPVPRSFPSTLRSHPSVTQRRGVQVEEFPGPISYTYQ